MGARPESAPDSVSFHNGGSFIEQHSGDAAGMLDDLPMLRPSADVLARGTSKRTGEITIALGFLGANDELFPVAFAWDKDGFAAFVESAKRILGQIEAES